MDHVNSNPMHGQIRASLLVQILSDISDIYDIHRMPHNILKKYLIVKKIYRASCANKDNSVCSEDMGPHAKIVHAKTNTRTSLLVRRYFPIPRCCCDILNAAQHIKISCERFEASCATRIIRYGN
ncbi:hypothetical protein AVEN_221157-1 [Araneus ventricosus]|uniref:Uncharacterized protein n=1 Tax=Araneus ventricosus TaxID=182803 RepID=A0A4Y2N026_ARAVE|nr:hypothetical protein AVEN_221157-1 [Araneus ventricosus]